MKKEASAASRKLDLPIQGRLADLQSVNAEARTADLVWTTGAPVERMDWWTGQAYIEELSLDPRHVDMSRMSSGAPLLNTHNRFDLNDVIGVVESASLARGEGRATVRFSAREDVEPIFKDVKDGIIRNVSVGYVVRKYEITKKKGEPDRWRAVDWQPMELSLVPIGADPRAGVRSQGNAPHVRSFPCEFVELSAGADRTRKEQSMSDENPGGTSAKEAPPAAVRDYMASDETIRQQAFRQMAKRNADIRAFASDFARWGANDLAARAVEDPAMTFDMFREQVLRMVAQRQTSADALSQAPANPEDIGAPRSERTSYGMGARDQIASANLQVFRGIGQVLGKKDHEVAYRAGMWARGVIFGDAQSLRWCRDAGVQLHQGQLQSMDTRTMTEGVFTSAGWLVPVEMETAIISNREQYGVARRICNVIPMGSASMTLPRITSDITAYFAGEGTDGTESDSGGDQVQLNLKDLMAFTKIGKSTAMDAVIPLAEMVAREQARAFAIKEDACLIAGDGTSTYGGMMGIINLLESAAYAGGRAAAASGHDTMAEIDAGDTAGAIGKLPVYARAGARWVVSGVGEAIIFGRLKLTAGGQTTQTLQGGVVESEYAGFPVSVAHNMPAVLTTLANKVIGLLGNFQLGVAFGSGSGMMLTVDPYTLAEKNLLRIITTERIDIVAHGVNKSTTVAGPIVCIYGTT